MDLIQSLYADSDSENDQHQQQTSSSRITSTTTTITTTTPINLTPNIIAPLNDPQSNAIGGELYSVARNPLDVMNAQTKVSCEPIYYSGEISSHYQQDRNSILKQKKRQRAMMMKQLREMSGGNDGDNDDDSSVAVIGKIPGFASYVYEQQVEDSNNKNRTEEHEENKAVDASNKQASEESESTAVVESAEIQDDDQHVDKKSKLTAEVNIIRGDDGETVVEGDQGGYSVFHLAQERDYQGRTFIAHPSHLKPKEYKEIRSYLPKKCIHTYTGHTNGISAIKFFPTYGHLLLSSSMDGTARIWGTEEGNRVCIRTYYGHDKAVKGLSFNYDGTRFATSSYDRTVKLWDTETGKVIGTYSNGSVPNCVEINPNEAMSYQMLAGCQDKKILQWDVREKKIVQTYDRHMGAVNTITFLDNGKQFLSTSEDKSLRLWDYGIPVEVKFIADPYMHATPFVGVHPNHRWLLGQSLDDHIYVYEQGKHGFRQFKKKLFKGHKVAGYACQCGFSNDGRFVVSGDSQGNVWFWDWKTGKHIATKKCHNAVTMGVAWHPIEASKMATASWDNTIKYWD